MPQTGVLASVSSHIRCHCNSASKLPARATPRDRFPRGDKPFVLMIRGKAVRGDPRSAVDHVCRGNALTMWKGVKQDGRIARWASMQEDRLHKGQLAFWRSPSKLAAAGLLHLLDFAFGLQALSLRTPARRWPSSSSAS